MKEVKVKKGKLLGKYNSMSVFMNNGRFGPFLKVNGLTEF
jgi:topoisomerase IA-like protein